MTGLHGACALCPLCPSTCVSSLAVSTCTSPCLPVSSPAVLTCTSPAYMYPSVHTVTYEAEQGATLCSLCAPTRVPVCPAGPDIQEHRSLQHMRSPTCLCFSCDPAGIRLRISRNSRPRTRRYKPQQHRAFTRGARTSRRRQRRRGQGSRRRSLCAVGTGSCRAACGWGVGVFCCYSIQSIVLWNVK